MNVNFLQRAYRNAAVKLFAAIMVACCAIFLLTAFIPGKSEGELFSKRVNLSVRAIGHHLLLRSGDSTSVVLPVVEKSKGVFLLQFENEFEFQPDTLVQVVQQFLAKTGLSNYTVTVQECHKPGIVYGFEINPPVNSIKACSGRTQPKGCYNIEIAFADFPGIAAPYKPLGIVMSSSLLLLAVVLAGRNIGLKKSKPAEEKNNFIKNESEALLTLGKFVFNNTNQSLRLGEETISLTDKECKILGLLNGNIGQLTLREELIQEVWTDEGVITGRSLDMFISKLRKKLSADPDLRITNIHGKGYRLEIVSEIIA